MTHPAAKAAAARIETLVKEGKSPGEAARIVGLDPFACAVFEAVADIERPAGKVLMELAMRNQAVVCVLKADGEGDLLLRGMYTCYPRTWDVDVEFAVAKVTPPSKEKLS